GKAQAARYAFQVQQARPDRPGFYCLSVKPQHFQIVHSSPVGLRISDHTPWENLDTLCAYVYSLYVPPDGHFLYDRTITWKETPNNPLSAPKWTVKTESATYTDAELIFLGNPWGRRTTILRAEVPGQTPVIIKEYYLDDDRRYEEGELLEHAHAEGYIPGLVRSVWAEDVMSDGRKVMVKDGSYTRRKRRIILADSGAKLEWAASVNDLLMVIYDVLEAHRTLVRKRAILHRDMSLYNILMYPELSSWPMMQAKGYYKDSPALIDEVLAGKLSDPDERKAHCLLIDLDNAARLDGNDTKVIRHELGFRTGTPIYIARAVAQGEVPPSIFQLHRMPPLSPQAKEKYVSVYGEERYNLYNDEGYTIHGGNPFDELNRDDAKGPVTFYHRWEYDAESVFWTLYSVLIRVVPQGITISDSAQALLRDRWTLLVGHTIAVEKVDRRNSLLSEAVTKLISLFVPTMHDVARLLDAMARQVAPSYASMPTPPPQEDHLHEALQRLILNYLVDHIDDPIPLTPGQLRETEERPKPVVNADDYRPSEQRSTTQNSKRRREEEAMAQAQTADGSQRESQKRPSVQLRRSARLASKNEPPAMAPPPPAWAPPPQAQVSAPQAEDGHADADEAPAPKRRR
ncbi:hypothetical protein BD413DRAFT_473673, partial [Trametes elegans]